MSGTPAHVVILAAGVGSRLSGTARRPKWLTPVLDRTIASQQLTALAALRDRLDLQVDVVTGHAADLVTAELSGFQGAEPIHNPQYAELNNWFTVLTALRERRARQRTGTFVVVNSDLWAPSAWFEQALQDVVSTEAPALLVDTKRPLTDEAMKVSATQDGGRLVATGIGKVGVTDPLGEYTGVLAVPADALPTYEAALEGFVADASRGNAWYEHAVGVTIEQGQKWVLVEAPGPSWVEIDDDIDLATATALAAS
ncbi:MAG: L-glutamine-phosphate cytidylyltransferase [Actinomycetota bacterium]|nr:L-glutamine-phosphate cytidylyltransferase [Actinomycetota bacterium]